MTHQQLTRLLADYLDAVDRFQMHRVHALRIQLRQYVANNRIGATGSLKQSEATLSETGFDGPSSFIRPK
jgi:hypothetical protein